MRNIAKDIEKVERLFDKNDKRDLTAPELNYLRDNYPDLVDMLHSAYMFGFAQGMKGGV